MIRPLSRRERVASPRHCLSSCPDHRRLYTALASGRRAFPFQDLCTPAAPPGAPAPAFHRLAWCAVPGIGGPFVPADPFLLSLGPMHRLESRALEGVAQHPPPLVSGEQRALPRQVPPPPTDVRFRGIGVRNPTWTPGSKGLFEGFPDHSTSPH